MKRKDRKDDMEAVVVYVDPQLKAKIDAYSKVAGVFSKEKTSRTKTVRLMLERAFREFDPVESAMEMSRLCKSVKLT